eukprot:Nk52_evm26s1837 gene=Nk52_evmTU26s1837
MNQTRELQAEDPGQVQRIASLLNPRVTIRGVDVRNVGDDSDNGSAEISEIELQRIDEEEEEEDSFAAPVDGNSGGQNKRNDKHLQGRGSTKRKKERKEKESRRASRGNNSGQGGAVVFLEEMDRLAHLMQRQQTIKKTEFEKFQKAVEEYCKRPREVDFRDSLKCMEKMNPMLTRSLEKLEEIQAEQLRQVKTDILWSVGNYFKESQERVSEIHSMVSRCYEMLTAFGGPRQISPQKKKKKSSKTKARPTAAKKSKKVAHNFQSDTMEELVKEWYNGRTC